VNRVSFGIMSYLLCLAVGDGVLNIDRSDHGSVFVDLLMQVPPLLSERPEDIMFFSSGWVKFIAWV